MSADPQAIMFRGVIFPEDYEFPWSETGLEDWWLYHRQGGSAGPEGESP